MSEGVTTYEECVAEAAKKGLVVVVPKPNELFIDIDSPLQMNVFIRQFEVFEKKELSVWVSHPSPSGELGHHHVVVTLQRDISNRDRILFQAVLGSDPMREILSLQRLDAGNEHPTLFFERPAMDPGVAKAMAGGDSLARFGDNSPPDGR